MPLLDGEAIMAALPAVLHELDEQAAFRIYLTDCLAGLAGVKKRYVDIINPPKESNMTAEEIVRSVVEGAGLHEEVPNECI